MKSQSQAVVAILISEPLCIVRAGLRAHLERESDFAIDCRRKHWLRRQLKSARNATVVDFWKF